MTQSTHPTLLISRRNGALAQDLRSSLYPDEFLRLLSRMFGEPDAADDGRGPAPPPAPAAAGVGTLGTPPASWIDWAERCRFRRYEGLISVRS